MPIHQAIRTARLGAGLSLRRLAHLLDVSPATMSAIETGKTGVSVERVLAIAEALDVDIRTLIGGMRRPSLLRNSTHRASSPIGGQVSWRDFPPLALDPVLRAAIESFVATGYHGATMRSLAQRAASAFPRSITATETSRISWYASWTSPWVNCTGGYAPPATRGRRAFTGWR